MRRTPHLIAILVTGILAASCHRLTPAIRPTFTLTAVVESIDANALGLRHKSGQRIRIAIEPTTAIVRRNSPAGISDITAGMRIVVVYRLVDGSPVADEVRLFRPSVKAAIR